MMEYDTSNGEPIPNGETERDLQEILPSYPQ